jgi:uncharacterized repeat protein (TIGR01451 family)/CSLREA domain-containing protein
MFIIKSRISLITLLLSLALGFFQPARADTFNVTTTVDTDPPAAAPNGCNTGGDCSLREAVLAANDNPGVDTIQLGADTYHLSIAEDSAPDGTTGDLDLTEAVTIQGVGPDDTIIVADASLLSRLIEISGTTQTTTVSGLTLQDGAVSGIGGAIADTTSFPSGLSIINCHLTNNFADDGGVGGAVFSTSQLGITDSIIEGNRAESSGGGVFYSGGQDVTIVNSSVSNNQIVTGSGTGGGISYGGGSTLSVIDSFVNNNDSKDGSGGGIQFSGPNLEVANTEIVGNTTTGTGGSGGGINFGGTNITVVDSLIKGNTANSSLGGGINANASTVILDNITVDNNLSDGTGAGVSSSANNTTITGSTLSNNRVRTSTPGGGGFLTGSLIKIESSTFNGNITGGDAGGLFIGAGFFDMTNSTVSGNSAAFNGGGINLSVGSPTISNTTITGNTADSDDNSSGNGGGIFNSSSAVVIKNSIIAGNEGLNGDEDCFGSFNSGGYNIIGIVSTNCTILPAPGDPDSTDLSGVDPLLQDLANNGGPTETHALGDGSPALDGGNPAGCTDGDGVALTTDQRGQVRPSGARCDIGAYEAGSTTLTIDKAAPETAAPGSDFVYVITVTNTGPGNSFDVTVTDTLPAGVSFVSVNSSQGDCPDQGATVSCNLGTLSAGDVALVTITVNMTANSGTITNTASVSGIDANTAQDSADTEATTGGGGGCSLETSGPTPAKKTLGMLVLWGALFLGWGLRRGSRTII